MTWAMVPTPLRTAVPVSVRRRVWFHRRYGRPLPRHPRTFNEKVTWRILYDRRPVLAGSCDKLAAKDVAERLLGGLAAVPRTAWSGTDVTELATADLPARWVLKPNHRSGLVVLGEGPPDVADLAHRTRGWTDDVHWRRTGEWAYRSARPGLLAEERLGGATAPPDLKVFVLDDEPAMVQVHTDRFDGHATRLYTPDWQPLPWSTGDARGPDAPRPQRLDDLLEAARRMAGGLDMMRVDFYEVDGRLWFGELTPYPGSGLLRYDPGLDAWLGARWRLPDRIACSARASSRG